MNSTLSDFAFPDDLASPHCYGCINLVGLLNEERYADNALAGCGLDGHLISNDDTACELYKPLKHGKD